MKRLLIVIVIILMIDQVLTPFSYVFSNEDEIFDMQENVVIENEVETESSEDIQDSTLENQNEEENTEDTTYDSTSLDNEIEENNQIEIIDEEIGEENNLQTGNDNELNDGNTTGDETEETNNSQSSTIVILIAQKLGIEWEEDAKYYAELAGIERGEYEGTKEQNEEIRLFLVEHEQEILNGEFEEIIEQKKAEDEETPDYSEYTKETRVAVLAEKLGIIWEEDAKYYAELVGIERGEYEGTREQNEQIRLFFLDNLEEILNGEYEETISEMKTENQEGLTGDEAEFEIEVETGSSLTGEIITENILTGEVITGNIELVMTGCSDDYHEENGLCETNTKTVRCEQKGGVENSAYIETGVTVTWDIIGGVRNETPVCEWECLDNYHEENGLCETNTKTVRCEQKGGVENSAYIETGVTITWDIIRGVRNEIPVCERKCLDNYHEENGLCESNTKTVDCEQKGGVENSTYIVTGVTITRDTVGGIRNETPACKWECKPHYHESENGCKIDSFVFTSVENPNVHTLGSTESGKKPYDSKIELEAYVDTGYRFLGWEIIGLNGKGISNTSVSSQIVFNMPDRDVTVTPLSEVIEYKIVYRNIDDAVMDNPDTYTIETSTFSLNEPTRTGYTLLGWTGSNGLEPEKQITLAKGNYGNKKYTAVWQPNSGIEYQVVHATEKANSTSYEIRETEILTGTTDELTQAVAKSYTGFTAKEVTQKTIKGDGSTAVRVQYQRNIYTISFDSNGGSELNPITGKYESNLTAPSNPIKSGYIFMGWKPDFPYTMPLSGARLIAQWKQELEVNNIENELITARETLNNKKIKGKETYNNVTVKVEAPKHSFPEGTELRITPITGAEQKQTIKEELMKNTDVTEESELVSFDISFIYTLSGGNEVELQPYTGETVKVSFNYKNNNKFNKSKKDKNKELKVYHFEKVKNKKGKKSEEVKEIEINESESIEGEIVIDAENFSIYSVALIDGLGDEIDNFDAPMLKAISRTDTNGLILDPTKGTVIIQLNANGGSFSNSSSTKNLNYGWYNREETKYAHTSNYDDNGNGNGLCTESDGKSTTVEIEGATNLFISVNYGLSRSLLGVDDTLTISANGINETFSNDTNSWEGNTNGNSVSFDLNLAWRIGFASPYPNGYYAIIVGTIPVGWRTQDYEKPTREGYLFDKRYTDTTYTTIFDDENYNFSNGGTTVYAKWNRGYTVTFNTDGGNNIEPQEIIDGQLASRPENPIKIGYEFMGWYSNPELTSLFNFSTPIIEDITLYAKWEEKNTYTVTFNSNGGSSVETQHVNNGERARKPDNPTKSNQGFKYWTTDSAGNNQYDFNTPVTSDLILYAQWGNICTVTFGNGRCYRNEGNQTTCNFTLPASIQVACGTPLRRPEDPESFSASSWLQTYTYYFSRWSRRNNSAYNNTSNDWDFDDPVTQSMTLYAMGNSTTYTVTFNANGGVLVGGDSQEVDTMGRNAVARKPDDPTRIGYDFKRWSIQNSTQEYDFTTQITENITLVAQWIPHTYTISYNANGGEGTMADTSMTYDTAKNLSSNMFTKSNATFSGWNTKADGSGTPYINGESANNLTDVAWRTVNLYAQWNCNNGYHDENGICVSDIQDCPLPVSLGGGTLTHGSGMIVYSTAGGQCPTTCTAGTISCNNGVLEGNTGYNYTGCNLSQLTCDASFTLNSTGINGTYSGCTSYTVNGNSCNAGAIKYKLTNCANGYHTENNSTCVSNSKQVACAQSGKPANSSYVAGNVTVNWQGTWNSGNWSATGSCAWICDPHYHTGANNNSCEIDTFQIIWLDGNGQTLKRDTVNYNETPVYVGATPTKTATAQYTYTFNNTWSPALVPATGDATYTAQFNSTVNQYTATILVNPSGYGTASLASVKKDYNSNIVVNGNKITIGGTEVIATPTPSDAQYTYTFSGWINTCGSNGTKLTGDCTITAQFNRTVNKYLITFKNWDGEILQTGMVEYGTTPTYTGSTPTKAATPQFTYTFTGWSPTITGVTETTTYTAIYNTTTNQYTATIGVSPSGYGSVNSGSVKKNYGAPITINEDKITIGGTEVIATPTSASQEFTYTFSGWNNTCGGNLTANCTITAQFKKITNQYTITFYDEDGTTELGSSTVNYGTDATYGGTTPTKAATQQYTYEFDDWYTSPEGGSVDDLSDVTADRNVYARYSFVVNPYTATIGVSPSEYGTVSSDSVTKNYGSTITENGNKITIGGMEVTATPTSDTSEWDYEFVNWTNNCNDTLTDNCTITANFTRTKKSYLIMFNNRDGSILQTGMVEYGTTPEYNGATPTKAADAQYTYTFVGWSPEIYPVNETETYTAQFSDTINKYNVTFDSNGGTPTPSAQSIAYGSKATKPVDPIRTGYAFAGWRLNGSDFDFNTEITGTINLVAKWNLVGYTITYNLNGGTETVANPTSYTVESGAITLHQPTRVGYTFLGWTGSNGSAPQKGIIIPSGSTGDRIYNAVWQANTNTPYTVYHYVKKVGSGTYELSDTETKYGTTDETLTIGSLAKENVFTCAHYDRGSLTGTEFGPGEVVTQTTIRGDGTTKIYLFYVRDYYNVYLTGDEHVDILKINGVETEHAVLECGSEVPVGAVPKPGYHFVRRDKEERERRLEEGEEDTSGE